MMPPTDSLANQNLALAGLMSSINTAQAQRPSNFANTAPVLYENEHAEDEDDDYEYPPSRPAPITIKIDASLKIEGHANTIVLPPCPLPSSNQPPLSRLSAGPSSTHRTLQTGRVEKLTGMVLTAFKDAGLLESAKDLVGPAASRSIDVHVDAGIILKGSKNTVCSGLPKMIKGPSPAAKGLRSDMKIRESSIIAETRKRRACSEPPESSMSKRTRST